MKSLFILFFTLLSLASVQNLKAQDQDPAATIKSIKLYKGSDQTSFPVIVLNSGDALELDFDDLSNNYRNYYYTFQLCNSDWSPSILHSFEYIKGFQNVHITNYRNSSIATFRYLHYQATVPDRNCYPSMSGNYLLKVFLDNDTSNLVFTKRFVVLENHASITAQIQQPYNPTLFQTAQKLQIAVQTDSRVQVMNPADLKVVVLQNNNWITSLYLEKPTIYRGNYFEYSDELLTSMPAGNEFRWIDLRSLRLMSDRMLRMESRKDTTNVYLKPEPSRVSLPYIYYHDLNGGYMISALEDINPFWQGDYAWVHFTYVPPGNKVVPGKDLYLFGELTNYGANPEGKMTFNQEKGVYENTLLLKQGYYNYQYALLPSNGTAIPEFSQTEGNYWGTENMYTILVYYRPFGARADQLVGYTSISSIFQRSGL